MNIGLASFFLRKCRRAATSDYGKRHSPKFEQWAADCTLWHGHKIWPWKYDIESLQLFHLKGDSADLYELSLGEGARTRNNWHFCTEEGTTVAPRGGPCTIASAGAGMIQIITFMDNPPPPTVESGTFQEGLREWGHTWMLDVGWP